MSSQSSQRSQRRHRRQRRQPRQHGQHSHTGRPASHVTLAVFAALLVTPSAGDPLPPAPVPVPAPAGQGTTFNPQPQPQLNSRTVRTKYGDVRGTIATHDSRQLEPVEVYRGIPYAMPPVGSLRFMPPVSGAQWSGVRLAQQWPAVCPQRLPDVANETVAGQRMPRGRLDALRRLMPLLANQSEDCLYLNIFAPTEVGTRENVRLAPVIVFIHGESYEWNTGNVYDGSVLASYGGVVVVTVNYRLGVLGFLNPSEDPHSRNPANYGLMDQIAALHWIQENVAAFGGDPTNVTLLGHGTGAACVHFLMMSGAVPDGQLFHRGVLMSGSALAPGALIRDPATPARMFAELNNCAHEGGARAMLACLRERPLAALLASAEAVAARREAEDGEPFGLVDTFGPSVDGVVIDAGDEPPTPEQPVDYARQAAGSSAPSRAGGARRSRFPSPGALPGLGMGLGLGLPAAGLTADPVLDMVLRKAVAARLSRYAMLLGVVRAEAFLNFSVADEQFGLETDRRTRILRKFVRNTYRYHRSEILATILNEYTDWERPVQHPVNLRDETLEALSDAQVVAPVILAADVHSSAASNRTFFYVFDYQTKNGDFQQRQGCIHGEELAYVLGVPMSIGLGHSHLPRNFTKAEAMLSEITMNYWINFARTGNPNDPVEPQRGGRHRSMEWPPYEGLHSRYMVLEPKPRIKSHYRAHRLSFWLHLVPELHRPGGEGMPLLHHALPGDAPDPPTTRLPRREFPTARPNATRTTASSSSPTLAPAKDKKTDPVPVVPGTGEGAAGIPPPAPDPTGPPAVDDGFAAYSTALSATVAIGCTLLMLNVIVFACVYHQREKVRPRRNRGGGSPRGSFRGSAHGGHGGHGSHCAQPSGSQASLPSALKKRPNENGTPRGMCNADRPCSMAGVGPPMNSFLGEAGPSGLGHRGLSGVHRPHFHMTPHCGPACAAMLPPLPHQLAHSHSMHQLPPPDFEEPCLGPSGYLMPFGGSATLPRPPPPPKSARPLCDEDQPLLSASAQNLLLLANKRSASPDKGAVGAGPGAVGTIRRKASHGPSTGPSSSVAGPSHGGIGHGGYRAPPMEELRV